MATQRKTRVVAARYLVDGDRNYKPGDEITEGQLYEQADKYAAIGRVIIEVAPLAEPKPEPAKEPVAKIDPQAQAALKEVRKAQEASEKTVKKASKKVATKDEEKDK